MTARDTHDAPEHAPMTTGFQLQLGPAGACRIVLIGTEAEPEAVLAVLEMDEAAADALAAQLVQRRETYENRKAERGLPQ